jgi:PIN domain nuclease of toxin-antitoxin system
VIVLDTHALIWWVTGTAGLSPRAKRTIETAVRQAPVIISAISVFEIATAVRRERLQLKAPLDEWLRDIRALPELHIEPVTADIAHLAGTLESEVPGDPADRIIAATAIVLETKLVTADERLSKSRRVETIW